MASSFISFSEKGFWARDNKLSVWLRLLTNEVDEQNQNPVWLSQMREYWETQFGMNGCISLRLDEFLFDSEKKDIVCSLSAKTLQRLDEYGEVIGEDELNTMNVLSEGSFFGAAISTEDFRLVEQSFIALLQGELCTIDLASSVI